MGVQLKDLIESKELSFSDLQGKVIVIDAFNMLYQFLSTIRGRDGSLLTDSKGNTTSHLIGLFSRTIKMLEEGIKPIFIFDGKAPQLKVDERKRRREAKEEAKAKYQIAVKEEDLDAMKKYASRTSSLNTDMIEDAKRLLDTLGVAHYTAPSEGEAQAAFFVKENQAYASVSQDFDSLLFGCPLLIRNLSIAGRRRKIHGVGTKTIKPELITLSSVLNKLGIDQEGLIALGMLVGTDYNRGGIKGIGPKNALKLIKKHAGNLEGLFEEVKWDDHCATPWTEIFYLFVKMPVDKELKINTKELDEKALRKFLIDDREFTVERVDSALERLLKIEKQKEQKGLGDFI